MRHHSLACPVPEGVDGMSGVDERIRLGVVGVGSSGGDGSGWLVKWGYRMGREGEGECVYMCVCVRVCLCVWVGW